MARWFLIAFSVICLVLVAQAFPQAEPVTPSSSAKIEAALSDVMESLQKSFKGIMENPEVNKLVQDGQKLMENMATSMQREAAKIMPKTDST